MTTCIVKTDKGTCGKEVDRLTAEALKSRGAPPLCPLHAAMYYLDLAKGALTDLEKSHPELRELRANPAYDFVRYAENCLWSLQG